MNLSQEKDRKRFLKIALIHGITPKPGLLEGVPPAEDKWAAPVAFESSYTTALGALALYSKGRGNLISPLFHSVPADSVEFAESTDFSFMEKINWDKHQHMEKKLQADFWEKLSKYEFTPYTEADWESVRAVRDYLSTIFN